MEEMVITNFRDLMRFYSSKKVFITGHTGFKGAWLSMWLSQAGAIIKGYSLQPRYDHGLFNYLPSELFQDSEINDIRNAESLEKSIYSFQPDIIFHLAAQPLVRASYDNPIETIETNVLGTANLLKSIKSVHSKCACVVITTDKVYKNSEDGRLYKESDPLGGYDPYSSSKACTEIVTESFRSSFYNPVNYAAHTKSIATARAGNVFGGGDWSEDRLVPDIVKALQENKEIKLRNPDSVRPWQHVLEPISGYLILGQLLYESPLEYSDEFNFGPEKSDHFTVGELTQLFVDAWGQGKWTNISNDHQKHEASLLQLDISKAKSRLNWRPRLSGKTAVEWTVDWYKAPANEKLNLTKKQIQDYTGLWNL
ncbi:CDP-glucose 4,6-dehydratase [Flavihumibacter cheonanensis]|uniref:CDP-glucose 4,6-dehydratase n=1 Tax=Flavihumibacter cheonanensis TaxID=1442385 RepID=UPI001EF877BE|nr:CDP-glucose 4,6-dehydratase [Flavihumibacter cheonanensis]MCG7751667.1 CDP-glucose 4,6-dehydratase [Flavihumibacter cheonanensis]